MGKKAYTVAVGNIPIFPRKSSLKALTFIQEQKGFLGFHPVYPHGTLCIFETKNDAIGARNLMIAEGIKCGKNICEVFIPES